MLRVYVYHGIHTVNMIIIIKKIHTVSFAIIKF